MARGPWRRHGRGAARRGRWSLQRQPQRAGPAPRREAARCRSGDLGTSPLYCGPCTRGGPDIPTPPPCFPTQFSGGHRRRDTRTLPSGADPGAHAGRLEGETLQNSASSGARAAPGVPGRGPRRVRRLVLRVSPHLCTTSLGIPTGRPSAVLGALRWRHHEHCGTEAALPPVQGRTDDRCPLHRWRSFPWSWTHGATRDGAPTAGRAGTVQSSQRPPRRDRGYRSSAGHRPRPQNAPCPPRPLSVGQDLRRHGTVGGSERHLSDVHILGQSGMQTLQGRPQ